MLLNITVMSDIKDGRLIIMPSHGEWVLESSIMFGSPPGYITEIKSLEDKGITGVLFRHSYKIELGMTRVTDRLMLFSLIALKKTKIFKCMEDAISV